MTDSLLLDTLLDRVPFLIHTFDGECSISIPVSSMFQILLDAFFRLRSVSIVPKTAKYFCSVMGFRFLALMLDSFSGFLKTSSLFRAKKPPNQACPGTPPLNGVFSFMVFARRPALQISCFREIPKPCSATLWALATSCFYT